MKLQVLDINYHTDWDKSPIIAIYGKTPDGRNAVVDVEGFEPYFYVLPQPHEMQSVMKDLEMMGHRVEEVERYKPIGYQSRMTKMIKVTTKSPKEVRPLRDELQAKKDVLDIYEADILFHNRFAADREVTGMSWIDVDGPCVEYGDVRPVKEPMVDAPLRIMSIDIECLSPESMEFPVAEKDPIILVSLAFNQLYNNVKDLVIIAKDIECTRPDTIAVKNEYQLLKTLRNVIREYDPDIITGYNIAEFDFGYIDKRMQANALQCNFGRDGSPWYLREIAGKVDVSIVGRIVIDTLPMVRKNFSLKEYKLKTVAKELLHTEKLDVPPKVMREYWFDGGEKFIQFVKYSRRDAVLGMMLIENLGMLQKYVALSKVSGIMPQTVVTGGQSVMLEFMMLQRYNRQGYAMAMKPQYAGSDDEDREVEYQGAFVSEPEVGAHDHLVLTDMQSLYPSIVIRYNLCPTTVIIDEACDRVHKDPNGGEFVDAEVHRGILSDMLDEVLQKRLAVKKEMKTKEGQERATLDAIQYALKIVINSAYGWTGYKRSRLFNLTTASAVTAYGRETISGVRDTIENLKDVVINGKTFNFKPLYTDTDSVYVKLLTDSDIDIDDADAAGNYIADTVSAPMKYPMKLNYEGYARRALFLAKKRYGMWLLEKDRDGNVKDKIKVKGIEIVRRDWCPLTGKTMKTCLDLILKEGKIKEASEYARETISRVRMFNINDEELLNELVLTRNYHKGADHYKTVPPHIKLVERMKKRGDQLPGLGDRMSYWVVSGQEPFAERAETIEYIRKNGRFIDTDYYINKQLIPPLTRVFEALKIDMMTGKKLRMATSLFDFAPIT